MKRRRFRLMNSSEVTDHMEEFRLEILALVTVKLAWEAEP